MRSCIAVVYPTSMTVFPGRLRAALDTLRGSYWLIPALMGLAAVVLAVTTGGIDRWLLPDLSRRWGRSISTAGPDGARAVLTTIAASMMTLASLTYSLTLVALTLAAGQYGPRLLRTFMRDRVTQVGLGAFLSTFVFCLAALRSVGASDDRASVPHVSVAVGMFMGALCLAYLVYFIHHVASSINATSVISAVSQELMTSIEAYGDRAGGPDERPPTPAPPEALRVPSPATGYVTLTDLPAMVKASEASDGYAWLVVRPGDFVVEGEPLALVVGIEDARTVVPQAIVIGPERTMLQDTEFGVAQLVEVALRALSPGSTTRSPPWRASTGWALRSSRWPPTHRPHRSGAVDRACHAWCACVSRRSTARCVRRSIRSGRPPVDMWPSSSGWPRLLAVSDARLDATISGTASGASSR